MDSTPRNPKPPAPRSEGDKAAMRELLATLSADIAKLARPTLPATEPMRRRLDEETRQRARQLQAEVRANVAKRRKEERQELEPPPQQDNSPTPQRLARLVIADPEADGGKTTGLDEISPPIADKDTRGTSKSYMVQGVVEFYAAKPKRPGKPPEESKWGLEEEQGARFLVKVWHKAESGMPRVTANYGGAPSTAYGPRDGGVKRGGKTEAHVDAHNELLHVEAIIFTNFGIRGLQLVRWFVWETERVAKEGSSVTEQMEHAGRTLAPFVKDQGRLWGLTFGSLQRIFYFSYAKWVANEQAMQRRQSTPEQIAARRQERSRRLGL